jgi:hypothetical protein
MTHARRALWLAALAAVALSAARARADVTGVLQKAATFDPTVHFGEVAALTIRPLLQARWTLAERTSEGGIEPTTVNGFSIPRARLIVTTKLFDTVSCTLRVGARSDGTANFEQAFVSASLGRFELTAGQFFLFLNAADAPSPQDLSSVDFSTYANTFSGGQTQGLQLSYDGPVHLLATLGNGARSGFSELLSPIVADVATTGRIEVPIGARRVAGFDVEPSFRKKQRTTARLGGVVHYQERGPHETSPAYDLVIGGGDVAVHGSGFSLLGSVTYLRMAPRGEVPVEDLGFFLFGSIFPSRRTEVFAQFDAVWPIGAHAPQPPDFANGQPGTTLFRTLTVGMSYFVLPDVNRFKLQLDLQTMFDGQTTSVAVPDPSLGVLATPGPQFAARLQAVVAL